jgi:hypothetical protein
VIKESVAYAMQEGWAPLRWALFTDNRVLYADKPFSIEAVICNEDILPPGSYAAEARIKGKDGIVWKKDFTAVYPADGYGHLPPLAATVLKENIILPEGEYTMYVRLTEGDLPYGGELRFTVVNEKPLHTLPHSVSAICLSENTLKFLGAHGIMIDKFDGSADKTVFVGLPDNTDIMDKLFKLMESGATVVFLNSELFAKEENKAYLKNIAGNGANCTSTIDWLYHFDSVHIRHPIFDGINDEGIIELDAFFELYPRLILTGADKADKCVCASIRADGGCCASSLTIGEYKIGNGKAVLNGFRIEEALGKNPYADRMLLNFISHYKNKKQKESVQ